MRRLANVPFVLGFLGAACSDTYSAEIDIDAGVEDFVRDTNALAKQACNASESDIESANEDAPAACYFRLANPLDGCERKALYAHSSRADALLQCHQRDRDALISCCSRGGSCSADKIDECYRTLWDGNLRGPCGAETQQIKDEMMRCFEEIGWVEISDPCAAVVRESIDWSASSELGMSPAQSFAPFSGKCSANYRLDFRSFSDEIQVTPAAMTVGTLQVSVTFSTSGARWVRGVQEVCGNYLEAKAQVHLESVDGVLNETLWVPVRTDAEGHVEAIRGELALDRLRGSLRIERLHRGTLKLRFQIYELGPKCRGDFSLEFESAPDREGGSDGMSGGVGSWGE